MPAEMLHSPIVWLSATLLLALLAMMALSLRPQKKYQPHPDYVPIEPATRIRFLARPPAAPTTEPKPTPATESAHADASLQVQEMDTLAEVDVFIEFGYLERAALTLRQYVDQQSPNNARELSRLSRLYLQLGDIHDYGEMLERLHDRALLTRDQLKEAILAGLQQDRTNLCLRVLAEQRLGMDVADLNQWLGDPMPPPRREEAPLIATELPDEPAASAPLRHEPLLEGHIPLQALQADERLAIRSLLPVERQARILLAWRDLNTALPVLDNILQRRPRSLSHRLDALFVHYHRHNLAGYTEALWHFHLALGPYGPQLKEDLQQAGQLLGNHPVLHALAGRPDRLHLEKLGQEAGYLHPEPPAPPRLHLVELKRASETRTSRHGDPLAEAEMYLSFGQTDMAMLTLEQAVLQQPESALCYPLLLDLYQHQGELARFTRLARQLQTDNKQPPADVTVRMAHFVQQMQHASRPSELAA